MARQPTLFIVRGLPGSGKSTVAEALGDIVRAADDFFMVDGEYRFDPRQLPQAHAACQSAVNGDLIESGAAVVANTFTSRWEFAAYLSIAESHGARIVVVDTFDAGMTDEELASKNVHGVPVEAIRAMRQRWEADWRAGDPRPPWERN